MGRSSARTGTSDRTTCAPASRSIRLPLHGRQRSRRVRRHVGTEATFQAQAWSCLGLRAELHPRRDHVRVRDVFPARTALAAGREEPP